MNQILQIQSTHNSKELSDFLEALKKAGWKVKQNPYPNILTFEYICTKNEKENK